MLVYARDLSYFVTVLNAQFAGKEHELMSKLVAQYGPEPENVCHVSESDTHSIQTC